MQTKQHKISTAFVYFLVAIIMFTGIIFAAGCDSTTGDVYYTVTFVTNGGNDIDSVEVKEGEKLTAPTTPVKDGYEFVGWYTDSSLTTAYSFTQNVTESFTLYAKWEEEEVVSSVVTQISYDGQTITLSASALYVDQSLTDDELSDYAFNSLEDCVAAAKDGTADKPTVIYLAADVYWTDDPDDESVRGSDELIGLEIPQSYITLIGMTGNYDDVIIASNRGQNTGANGNYNTIGVGNGFSAYGITFGNYCNVDLVYARDTSKNREKRAAGIVQAQTVTNAGDTAGSDMRYYENCSFVSRLNCIATWDDRAVYNKCHIECTDDSLGSPAIALWINCDFDLYGQTPNANSTYMQAFLGCTFTTHFDSYTSKKITLTKSSDYYAVFIDCDFLGDLEGFSWVNAQYTISDNLMNVVYNCTINGNEFTGDDDYPDTNIVPAEDALLAFKVGDVYNVYNMVNGVGNFEEWDPLGQQDSLMLYLSPWAVKLSTSSSSVISDGNDSVMVSADVCGYSDPYTITWSVDRTDVTITDNKDGTADVTAVNYDYLDETVCVTATTSNGISKVIHITLSSPTLTAPEITDGSASINVAGGYANLSYVISDAEVSLSSEINPDMSVIEWYRSLSSDGSGCKLVATTTYVKDGSVPYTDYKLTSGDAGYYLIAKITPQYKHSYQGQAVTVISSDRIAESDITDTSSYYTDFVNLAYLDATYDSSDTYYTTWTNTLENGFWYGGFYRPSEYNNTEYTGTGTDGEYSDKFSEYQYVDEESAYTYASGSGAASGLYGYKTTTRGARLVYIDSTARTDMTMTVNLSSEKADGQGFGSAKQYFEIYFKYDAETQTGYGLRISRINADKLNELIEKYPNAGLEAYADYNSKSCLFQLMSYENGVVTELCTPMISSAFLQDVTVVLKMSGNVLTCEVSTTTVQSAVCAEVNMPHSVSLSCTLESANKYGGFGFQHTGTAGSGKEGNRTLLHSLLVEYDS